jgi:CRP-like cAMP-binding protein
MRCEAWRVWGGDEMEIGGSIMVKAEKREKQRVMSTNLLNYISIDHNYREVSQGMGRTINMSETGLLIETPTAIDPEHFLSLNIGLANEQFKVHGKVIYTTCLKKTYRTGILFNQAPKAGYTVFQHVLSSLQNGPKLETASSKKLDLNPFTLPKIKGPKSDYLYVADEETYRLGEKIITQGNFGNWAWLILDGWVTVVRETLNGAVPIFKIGPGGFIGSSMSYLMKNQARTNSVISSGNVQLGLLDTQQMTTEYSALSPELKGILISLSGRLKRIIDRIVSLRQGKSHLKEDILSGEVIFESDQNELALHSIVRGKGTMLYRDVSSEIPLVNLYPGDFVGSLPFGNKDFISDLSIVRRSTGFETKELNRINLLKEYESLPQTLKNMIEFTALKIFTGSTIVAQIMARKSYNS